MVKRSVFAWVVVACAACATVADLEVNRVDGGGSSDRDDADEAGTTPPAEAGQGGADAPAVPDTGPPTVACGCDAGSACCIRSSSSPSCSDPSSCTEPGSLVVGCTRSSTDGRDCCWSADGGIARASTGASGCAASTAACIDDDDCVAYGGKCTTLACKGVAVGVCAASAPSWFVCPP
jgi:hypothetical protein